MGRGGSEEGELNPLYGRGRLAPPRGQREPSPAPEPGPLMLVLSDGETFEPLAGSSVWQIDDHEALDAGEELTLCCHRVGRFGAGPAPGWIIWEDNAAHPDESLIAVFSDEETYSSLIRSAIVEFSMESEECADAGDDKGAVAAAQVRAQF